MLPLLTVMVAAGAAPRFAADQDDSVTSAALARTTKSGNRRMEILPWLMKVFRNAEGR